MRYVAFAILCGIIVASLSAHITAFAEENFEVYYAFAALGIATGALTLFTLPVMYVFSSTSILSPSKTLI